MSDSAFKNDCNFLGRVQADPIVRYMSNGETPVVDLDIEVVHGYGKYTKPAYVKIRAFNKQAEELYKRYRMGDVVEVSRVQFVTVSYKQSGNTVRQQYFKLIPSSIIKHVPPQI